jgi:glycyl-tRNA synthetase beta chain
MATLLIEIGCEELPASACYEAERQLPGHIRSHLGLEPSVVYVGPRRLAVIVEGAPDSSAPTWVSGPPVDAPAQAKEGFARKHGVPPEELEERDGRLGVEVAGQQLGDLVRGKLDAIVYGLAFSKSMRWGSERARFSRPVRWVLAKLDDETVAGQTSFGRRFANGPVEIPSAAGYQEALRAAGVEPDQDERRRRIVAGLDAFGTAADPLGKLDEVVHLSEWPTVLEATFDERFLRLPRRVVETAMQSHQRYFPLGGNRFALVSAGGDPDVIVPGYVAVLEGRLDDAGFTFDRDVAVGIEELAARLDRITFFEGGGTYADKTERVTKLVAALGGQDEAVEAARLAKADQASELVREFAALEGVIGAEYARLAGKPEEVCLAIEEHYLPDGADAPLPSSAAGRILAAADKIDTLKLAFSLGHRPTGSRDPFGLRRAAIGLCRLAVEGSLAIRCSELEEAYDFVEERLEGYLDVPVEFVRAARAAKLDDIGSVAELARYLAARDLAAVHEVYVRASRIVGDAADGDPVDESLLGEDAERELARAVEGQPADGASLDEIFDWAASLAPVVERFFMDVLVMVEDERLRANRFRLLRDVRRGIGRLGDLSEIPL